MTKEEGYIIHLDRAVEREAAMEAIRRTFFMPLVVAPASNGEAWMRDETIHKQQIGTQRQISQGNIGCTQSHLSLLRGALEKGLDTLVIFEDDCEFIVDGEAVKVWMNEVQASGAPWDILLFGATEYVNQPLTDVASNFVKVNRFWGTHALVVRPRAAAAAIKAFAQAQMEGVFLPADWMYNEAIRQEGLICLGPAKPKQICRQMPGFVSAITGNVRS